jgi:hypothetical protein
MDLLMTDPLQWQPLEIFDYKADEVTAIEVSREGQPPISIERDKDKTWKLAKGDGAVKQINAQSLVNTLAKLRAVRWFGAIKPEYALEHPGETVTFKVGNGGGKLMLGGTSPEEFSYASVATRAGAFAVSKPDLTALQLPLLEKVAATPAPASPAPAPAPMPEAPAAPAPATEAPAKPAPPQP